MKSNHLGDKFLLYIAWAYLSALVYKYIGLVEISEKYVSSLAVSSFFFTMGELLSYTPRIKEEKNWLLNLLVKLVNWLLKTEVWNFLAVFCFVVFPMVTEGIKPEIVSEITIISFSFLLIIFYFKGKSDSKIKNELSAIKKDFKKLEPQIVEQQLLLEKMKAQIEPAQSVNKENIELLELSLKETELLNKRINNYN
ncbi:hypothetical protein LC040_08545 [Bacillus tianshenii]|nr:hypothetical protein LC040_08545 [Bacillus tianshenii]